MKILIPWYRFPPFSETSTGGLSVSMYELCLNLADLGHDVEVLVPPSLNSDPKELFGKVKVTRDPVGEKLVSNTKPDSRFFDNYDIVLSIDNFGGKSLRSLSRGNRIVRQIHTVAPDRPVSSYLSITSNPAEFAKMFFLRRREIERERSLKGLRSICVSRYLLRKMNEFGLESERNLSYVPNGIDTKLFCPGKREVRYDLLFVGRFQRVKGLDILIGALNLLSERGRNPSLGIIGPFDAQEREYCFRLAKSSVRNHIEFLGHIDHANMPKAYDSCKILIVPSTYESFCLPVLEAMACGVAVVGTRVGGLPELIDDELGLLAEPNSEISLADCIFKVLDAPKISENTLTKGPIKASKYDWNVVIRDFSSEMLG